MWNTMREGAILVRDGAVLPKELQVETEVCVPGWKLVKDFDGHGLDRAIREAGWTFFCLVGEIRSSAFGINERTIGLRAIDRIVATPRVTKFNSLEITGIVSKRFLGVRYMRICVQLRHIQKSLFLSSADNLQDSGWARRIAARNAASGSANMKALVSEAANAQGEAAAALSR